MHAAIEEFLADLAVEGRGKLTIEGHQRYLLRLAEWHQAEGLDWQETSKKDIQRYMRLFATKAISTRNNCATSLRTFYRWAVEQGYVAMSPAAYLKTVRRHRPVPKAMTVDQVRRWAAYVSTLEGRRGRRDRALMVTGVYAGLRSEELARLRWADVDMAGGLIIVRNSKGNHGRSVPMHPQLLHELASWRDVQELPGADVPVFSLDGEQLVSERCGKVCRAHSKISGIPFTCHTLRHTFATMVLRKSRNLFTVSRLLGHLDIKQTEIYLSCDVEDLRDGLNGLPGMGEW